MKKVFEKKIVFELPLVNGRGDVVRDDHGGMDATASLTFFSSAQFEFFFSK